MIGVLLLSAFWSTSPVQAQTTSVVCRSNFNYLNNQEGQNPCLVSAYLQVPCASDGTSFDVPPITVDQSYPGPEGANVNYCGCSSVVYSLISACAQCQGVQWVSWSFWRGNCPQDQITVGQYPLDIPVGTGVPAWAYQDVSLTDFWNATLALPQVTTAPESTYYGTPTASISYSITTAADVGTQTNVPSPTQSSSPANGSSSKSNAGPIAGGVIGGIALLALIGAVVWLLIRRRRKEALIPSPTAYYPPGGPQMGEADNFPAAVDYGASYPATTSPTLFSGSSTTPNPPKLYDPEDPSTFPKTPASFGYQSTNITDTTSPSHPDSTTPGGGRYTGAAEI